MKGGDTFWCRLILMKKKMTRADFEKIVADKYKQAKSVVMDTGLVEKEDFVVIYDSIVAGARTENFYCQRCGHTEQRPKAGYYHTSNYVCPDCGNDNITSSRNVNRRERKMFVKPNESGAEGFVFSVGYYFPDENDFTPLGEEPKARTPWYKMEPVMTVNIKYAFVFDREYGWFMYNGEKLYKRGCQDEVDRLVEINRMTPMVGSEMESADWNDLLAEAKTFEAKRAAQASVRKANSKSTVLEDMRAQYRAQVIDEDIIKEPAHTFLKYIYSQDEAGTSYQTVCTKCGHEFITQDKEDEYGHSATPVCPHCGFTFPVMSGHRYSSYGTHEYTDVVVYENTNLPENDLLVRIFRVNHNYEPTKELETTVTEFQRVFCGKKVTVYGKDDIYGRGRKVKQDFTKATIRDLCGAISGWRVDGVTIQTKDDIRDIIRNSCLMYSGAVEAYGIGDSRYKQVAELPHMKYIMTWYKNPGIELVAKANMSNIAKHMLDYPDHMHEGKTIAEIIGLPAPVVKVAMKEDMTYEDMVAYGALYNTDNTLTYQLYKEIKECGIGSHHLVSLRRNHNIDYAKAMKYFEAVYNHQCIEKREAATLWLDYLRMATDLKMDLTDKSRLFPGSLKKEHDVAMFAHRAIQVELDKAAFAKQAEINASYEYSYKDLVAIVPRTPQEIVEEATRQKNCLRSYVERVKRGDTVVVFIRKKEDPEATYVTAEVYGGILTQLKGYCNSNPRQKDLVEFVTHWAKARNIVIDC